jgi:uncharacterized protein (TIGR02594 family)
MSKLSTTQLSRIERKVDQIDVRTQYLSRVVNNVQNASDAIWGATRPMLPWYFSAPVALLITVTTLNPLQDAGTPVSAPLKDAYTYTRYAGEAVGAWLASIQYAKPNMAWGQQLRGLNNAMTAELMRKIRQRESSTNYAIWNTKGYIGAWQGGAAALTQTGYIHREAFDNAPDCVKSGSCGAKHLAFLQDNQNWTAGVDFDSFMSTPSIQDGFFVKLAQFNIDQGFARGVLRADNPKRTAGFVAVAHLQGIGAAVDYYLHGRNTNKGGAYASEYAAIGESAVPDVVISGSPVEIAKGYLGLHERDDRQQLRKIVGFDPVGDAWCAGFVNGTLRKAGMTGTGKDNARSFLEWGKATATPRKGDVVVLWRGSKGDWRGHVGYYYGTSGDNVLILGGNQNNQVSIESYPKARVLGYRTVGREVV